MQKLYCYVDESGQDTKGKIFLVSVVIAGSQREELRNNLKKIERMSGKGSKKWMKSTRKQREKYIKEIINRKDFIGKISYSIYRDTRAYVDLVILTTAQSILKKAKSPYETTVFVDGLGRTERHRFAAGLRKLKIKIRKVRGLRDQSDEFIRLADAAAGFVRNYLEGDKLMGYLYKKAEKNKIIQEI